jgi:hypothetical protein
VVLTGSLATVVLSDTDGSSLHSDGTTSQPCPPLQWPSLFLAYVRAVLAPSSEGADLPTLADLRDAYRVLSRPAEADRAL